MKPETARADIASAIGLHDQHVPDQAVQAVCELDGATARKALNSLPDAPRGVVGPALESWVVLSVTEAIRIATRPRATPEAKDG